MFHGGKSSEPVSSISRCLRCLFIPILVLWSGCSESASQSSPSTPDIHIPIPQQIDDGLETGSLSQVGMIPDPLIELVDLLDSTPDHRIHSMLIYRNNKLVFERYWDGYDMLREMKLSTEKQSFGIQTLHYVASVSKSVTSALMGIAFDKGLINSVDETAFFFFPNYNNLKNGNNEGITIEFMLKMSSGYDWNEFVYPGDDPRDSHYQLMTSSDPVAYLLGRPVVSAPGSKFHYNSGDTNLLGEIIRRKSLSNHLYEFAEKYLFEPLGIETYYWYRLPLADYFTFASGGLFLTPRDMLKIGTLYINDGRWNGEQIISPTWIHESFENTIPLNDVYAYGYQWWLAPAQYGSDTVQSYCAIGWGGQHVVVVPELKLAVVWTAGGYYENSLLLRDDIINDYVLKAIID